MAKKTTSRKKSAAAAAPAASSYDAIPYVGRPRPFAHPDDMAVRAHLFGIDAPDIETARVLEIGCADGANLMSIAATLPKSVCVGIDQSETQIAKGEKLASEAGLKNVFLGTLDFGDLPEKPEEVYDYVIAHGVYSWVSPEKQESLLQKIKGHLSPKGVAFVSYNCLPGWHLRQMMRDFLLYHTAGIEDPVERVARCRSALPGLIKSVPPSLQAYAALLTEEHQLMEKAGDDYIAHEHLEENNRPCYFHEFASQLSSCGLQFLCEAELSSMRANRYPRALAELSLATGGEDALKDPIRSEQYLDFANLRMFRQTTIVHDDVEVDRNLKPARIQQLSASAYGVYKDGEQELTDKPETFQGGKGASITTGSPVAKAAMRVLSKSWPERIPFAELEERSQKMVEPAAAEASTTDTDDDAETVSTVAELLLAGATVDIVSLHRSAAQFVTTVSEKPVASPLARAQAVNTPNISTLRHQALTLNSLGQHLLTLLDGDHDHGQLAAAIIQKVGDGSVVLQEDGLTVTAPADVERLANVQVKGLLGEFARAGLLIG